MATKAISTWVSDTFIFMVRLLLFIVFGNPLSMCVLNLLVPRKTNEFAKNRTLFSDDAYAFYEHFALKWPFHWARWWMKLENLGQYSVDQQIKYFFKVATKNKTEAQTLKAMQKSSEGETFWPEAHEVLFFKYGDKLLSYTECYWQKQGDLSVGYSRRIKVIEFMMRHVRLSWHALKVIIEKAVLSDELCEELKKYLATGKLNDAQFELLIDAVATDSGSGSFQMLGVLLDYVKRYGISQKYLERVHKQYPKPFSELVEDALTLYKQMKLLKAFKNSKADQIAWLKFCKESKLLPEVQKLMSTEQYHLFHTAGCKLDAEVIKSFLQRSDKELWKSVFAFEKETCQTEDVRSFIRGDANLELIYREVSTE